MKKFNTNRLRAFFMALLLVLTSTSTTNVLAKADYTAVVLDKVEKYNSISKCVSRAKILLDNIEIQYKNELEKLNNKKKD